MCRIWPTFDVGHIDFDELGQILRQAAHFDFGERVRNIAAFELHANALVLR